MSLRAPLMVRSALAIVIGVTAIAWPSITIGAFVVLFAVHAIAYATRAFSRDRAGPVFGCWFLSIIAVAAGTTSLACSAATALALSVFVGAWAVIAGVFHLGLTSSSGERAGERPDIGAVSLADVFGLYNVAFGFSALVLSKQADGFVSRAAQWLPTAS